MHKQTRFVIISAATAFAILAAIFVASFYIRAQLTENLTQQYVEQEALLSQQVAHTLELEVAQTQAKLELVAKYPEVRDGDTAACNAKLQEVFDNPSTKVGNLGRVGPDGLFRCSLNTKLIGVKAETLGAYITKIFNDPAHAPVMSRAIKPPGAPSYLVAIHVPVWGKDGSFQGTLGGAVYLNDLGTQYLKGVSLAPGGYIALFDDDGTVLYHYKPELIGLNVASPDYQKFVKGGSDPKKAIEDIKEGLSGTRRYSFDGDKKIAAFGPVHIFPERNWRILVTVPARAADDSIAASGVNLLLELLPIAFAALLIVIYPVFLYAVTRGVFNPLAEIDKAKSEFVSLASHQLRTPLSAINWYSEMLLAGDAGALNEEQKKFVDEIYAGNQRMVELVNALLNVSRLELGTFLVEPAPTDVAALAQSVIDEQKPEIARKQQQFTASLASGLPQYQMDQKLLRMVVQNLLSNAVKYTPEHGTVSLDLSRASDGALRLRVADTGYGIPKEQQKKIFSKLFRADNVRAMDTEGTGLGLYIVKSIIDHAGGSIRFESEEGKGTTFFVEFPAEGMKKRAGTKSLS